MTLSIHLPQPMEQALNSYCANHAIFTVFRLWGIFRLTWWIGIKDYRIVGRNRRHSAVFRHMCSICHSAQYARTLLRPPALRPFDFIYTRPTKHRFNNLYACIVSNFSLIKVLWIIL